MSVVAPTPICRCHLDLLPLSEVAARLDVSVQTLKNYHRRYGLPLVRLSPGAGYFGLWSAIEAWARERGAVAKSPNA